MKAVLGFGVGFSVGLAPFLGRIAVPGYDPLLSVFPEEFGKQLIPLSAFLMGSIAAASQFMSGTKRAAPLRRTAKRVLVLTICSFGLFVIAYFAFVRRVQFREDMTVARIVGLTRIAECECKTPSDAQCIFELSAKEDATEKCWGTLQVQLSKLILGSLYLTSTGAFVFFVATLLAIERKAPPSVRVISIKGHQRPRKGSP